MRIKSALIVLGIALVGTLALVPGPAAAASGVHEIANTVTLTGTSTGPVLASCPPGEVALGGGWSVPSQDRVFAAQLNGNTWAVSVAGPSRLTVAAAAVEPQPGTEAGAGTVTAYIECVFGVAGLVVTSQTLEFSLPANQRFSEAVYCGTKNGFPVGFGFNLGGSSANIWLDVSQPLTSLVGTKGNLGSWIIGGWNRDSVAHSASLSVQCLAAVSSPLYLQNTGGIVSAVTTESVTAQCPPWTQVVGGGFYLSSPTGGTANPYLIHAANGSWQYGTSGVTGSVLTLFVPTAYAICVEFPSTPPKWWPQPAPLPSNGPPH